VKQQQTLEGDVIFGRLMKTQQQHATTLNGQITSGLSAIQSFMFECKVSLMFTCRNSDNPS
jgi:hypothetical protein